MVKKALIIIQLLLLCQINAVWADDDNDSGADPETQQADALPPGTVTSMQAYSEIGKQTTGSLTLAADYALDQGDFETAIKYCKAGLDKDYGDLDIHMSYAKALQAKLKTQKERDINLYSECVKEWLIVYRTEVGFEKDLSFHGINPLGHFYEDEERSIPARQQLIALTGRAPKAWETDAKYLKWVNRPTTAVAGKIIQNHY
jgi:hypothetical protein